MCVLLCLLILTCLLWEIKQNYNLQNDAMNHKTGKLHDSQHKLSKLRCFDTSSFQNMCSKVRVQADLILTLHGLMFQRQAC